MGQLDIAVMEDSYETRELAWELQQPHPDQQRIRLFLEQDADLRRAMTLAHLAESDLAKKPALKPLKLDRHLREHALPA